MYYFHKYPKFSEELNVNTAVEELGLIKYNILYESM